MTVASFLTWTAILDLGIGNGLRNNLATALAAGETEKARRLVSSAYAMMGAVSLLGSAAAIMLSFVVDWPSLLNAPLELGSDLRVVGAIVFGSLGVRLGLGLMQSILLADQRPAAANLMDAAGNVVGLALVAVLAVWQSASFTLFAAALTIGPVIVYAGATLLLFRGRYRTIAPARRYVERGESRDMMRLGVKFFVLQSVAVVLFSSIPLVVAHLSGPEEVARFSVVSRYFAIPLAIVSTVLIPYWSAFTQAYARGEIAWIRRTIRHMRLLFGGLLLVLASMVAASESVYTLWIGTAIDVPLLLSLCFAGYVAMSSWCSIYVTLLNGIGRVRLQVFVALGMLTLFVPVSVFMHHMVLAGSSGVVLSLCFLLLIPVVLWPVQVERLLRGTASGIWSA